MTRRLQLARGCRAVHKLGRVVTSCQAGACARLQWPVLSTNSAVPERKPRAMVARAYNGGMRAALQPIQLVLLSLAGWISQHQQDVIDYLVEENRVLKEQHKGRALRLTDDQRRRLAAKASCPQTRPCRNELSSRRLRAPTMAA